MRKLINWPAVQHQYNSGSTVSECRILFGLSKTSLQKAILRGKLILNTADRDKRAALGPGNYRYDWAAVQKYYDLGNSYRACQAHFGFSANSWTNAVRRGDLIARARQLPLAELLLVVKCRTHLKIRLLQAGILKNRCDKCGISDWRGEALSVQIDHRNGVRDDHRLENLRMLCPNCHSQTTTFGSRNIKLKKANLAGIQP